jgi:Na+/H+-dicarboxylate symporter
VLLITNTLAAIIIGLIVVNVLRPGQFVPRLGDEIRRSSTQTVDPEKRFRPLDLPSNAVPTNLLEPITSGDVFKLILPALAFGIAIRQFKNRQIRDGKTDYLGLERGIGIGFDLLLTVLLWVIVTIPLAVLCVVTAVVGKQGPRALAEFLPFILVVILALLVQLAYYLVRIGLETRAGPLRVLAGVRDALATAFSTASSTATMPITYNALVNNVKLRPKSASLGALVGANFNNDGTALYEAVAALFIAQAIGQDLGLGQQLLVVVTAIIASVGAAGIPEAGLVTMVLVLTAVGLPPAATLIILPVDWFLDRCRTALNVMGDVTVATLLDAKEQTEGPVPPPSIYPPAREVAAESAAL